MANDNPVNVDKVDKEVQGQPQAAQTEPHDGKVHVREIEVAVDKVILDPNDPLAVQVPKFEINHPGEVYEAGTPEEQFGSGKVEATKPAARKSD